MAQFPAGAFEAGYRARSLPGDPLIEGLTKAAAGVGMLGGALAAKGLDELFNSEALLEREHATFLKEGKLPVKSFPKAWQETAKKYAQKGTRTGLEYAKVEDVRGELPLKVLFGGELPEGVPKQWEKAKARCSRDVCSLVCSEPIEPR